MKKVLISVLLVLLTLCLFVSCSSSPKVKEEPTPTTKTIELYSGDTFSHSITIPYVDNWKELFDLFGSNGSFVGVDGTFVLDEGKVMTNGSFLSKTKTIDDDSSFVYENDNVDTSYYLFGSN